MTHDQERPKDFSALYFWILYAAAFVAATWWIFA